MSTTTGSNTKTKHDAEQSITNGSKNGNWIRLLYMIFLFIVLEIAEAVIFLLVIACFLVIVFKGNTLEQAVRFGASRANYIKNVIFSSHLVKIRPPGLFQTGLKVVIQYNEQPTKL